MIVRMRFAALFLSLLVAGAMTACSGGDSSTPTPAGIVLTDPISNPTATPEAIVTSFDGEVREFEVNLAINGSPQQGTAVFTKVNDYPSIEIKLKPGAAAQQATLRRGSCPQPEGFVESLDLVIGGIMRQELRKMPFEDLLEGNMTLVISTDDESFNSFAACADLPTVD